MANYVWELMEKWLTRNEVRIPRVETTVTALPEGAASEATLADIKTAVQILDDVIAGNEAQVDIVGSLPAGSSTIGSVGLSPSTTGGLSVFRSIDLDETEEEAKNSAGQLYGWYLYNLHATEIRYIKIYDGTEASVVVGTTTPKMTIPLAARQGANVEFANGIAMVNGITLAATTGLADSDTGAPGANEVVANIFFK